MFIDHEEFISAVTFSASVKLYFSFGILLLTPILIAFNRDSISKRLFWNSSRDDEVYFQNFRLYSLCLMSNYLLTISFFIFSCCFSTWSFYLPNSHPALTYSSQSPTSSIFWAYLGFSQNFWNSGSYWTFNIYLNCY